MGTFSIAIFYYMLTMALEAYAWILRSLTFTEVKIREKSECAARRNENTQVSEKVGEMAMMGWYKIMPEVS